MIEVPNPMLVTNSNPYRTVPSPKHRHPRGWAQQVCPNSQPCTPTYRKAMNRNACPITPTSSTVRQPSQSINYVIRVTYTSRKVAGNIPTITHIIPAMSPSIPYPDMSCRPYPRETYIATATIAMIPKRPASVKMALPASGQNDMMSPKPSRSTDEIKHASEYPPIRPYSMSNPRCLPTRNTITRISSMNIRMAPTANGLRAPRPNTAGAIVNIEPPRTRRPQCNAKVILENNIRYEIIKGKNI